MRRGAWGVGIDETLVYACGTTMYMRGHIVVVGWVVFGGQLRACGEWWWVGGLYICRMTACVWRRDGGRGGHDGVPDFGRGGRNSGHGGRHDGRRGCRDGGLGSN